ncbi:MAG TPA: type IV pilin protein [Steroidobacteraceae bacterium]|nr:type IV pilin protein [Steroidobacteraceae bacterium]
MQLATPKHERGMTLIELMVVVVIATILVSLAVPSYMAQVRQSRRVEAKTALLDLAGREERYFSTSQNGANYSQTGTDLGYAALPAAVGNGYYTVSVCAVGPGMAGNCPPSAQAAPAYVVTATPVAGQSQVNDTQCQSFSVDNTGRQWATDAGGNDTTTFCWNN